MGKFVFVLRKCANALLRRWQCRSKKKSGGNIPPDPRFRGEVGGDEVASSGGTPTNCFGPRAPTNLNPALRPSVDPAVRRPFVRPSICLSSVTILRFIQP